MTGLISLTDVRAALVTGQLAQDITAVGLDLEELYGTLNEENLKLE